MRVGWRAAAVAAVALAAACGGADDARRRSPAEPELRIWNPLLVRWEAGRPRHVDFAIENPTNRTIAMAAPDAANARVEVYAGPEAYRVCGVSPSGGSPGARVALAPGDRVPVRVDLDRACGAVPPGEYRYLVSYEAPPPPGAGAAPRPGEDEDRERPAGRREDGERRAAKGPFSGTLPPRYGQVLVSAPQPAVACAPDAPEPRAAAGPARQGRAPQERERSTGPRRRGAQRRASAEGPR